MVGTGRSLKLLRLMVQLSFLHLFYILDMRLKFFGVLVEVQILLISPPRYVVNRSFVEPVDIFVEHWLDDFVGVFCDFRYLSE